MKKNGSSNNVTIKSKFPTGAQECAMEHSKELNAIMCHIASKTLGEKFTMNFPVGKLTIDIINVAD